MPFVNIKMTAGRSVEQKRALVSAVTEAVASTLGTAEDRTWVVIEDISDENWALGGILVRDLAARKS